MSKMIIIGTGASAAIDPSRFPTMDNFFQGVLGCAKSDEDKRLIANFLSILDYERIFVNRHIDCENLAAQWRLFMSPKRSHLMDTDAIRNCYLDILGSRFVSNRHAQENLEILLNRSLNAPDGSSFSSILYMLNWLLGYFDDTIERKSQALHHKLFDKFIGSDKQCSLVSFNYDLLLDRALVSWLGKSSQVTDKGIKQLLTRCDSLHGIIDPATITIFDNSGGGRIRLLLNRELSAILAWMEMLDCDSSNHTDLCLSPSLMKIKRRAFCLKIIILHHFLLHTRHSIIICVVCSRSLFHPLKTRLRRILFFLKQNGIL